MGSRVGVAFVAALAALAAAAPVQAARTGRLVAFRSCPDLVTYAKANAVKLQYSSGGAGGSNHLACVLLNSAIGLHGITHIPYRGAGQALQDVLAGRVDYSCPSLPTAIPLMASQSVKALAILSRKRSPSVPDLASASPRHSPAA